MFGRKMLSEPTRLPKKCTAARAAINVLLSAPGNTARWTDIKVAYEDWLTSHPDQYNCAYWIGFNNMNIQRLLRRFTTRISRGLYLLDDRWCPSGKLYVALRMDCHERGHYTGPSDVHLLGCFTSEDLARDACRQAGLNMASLSPEDDEVWGPGLARIIEITPDTSMDEWLA